MLPQFAIVGRPNVGKSTLFNRLTRSRRSIVGDEPGITRDRIYGEGEWRGRRFRLVDTGGIAPGNEEEIPSAIFRQARAAIAESAAVLFLVDARAGMTAADSELGRLLLRSGKPILLLANKMEGERQEWELSEFHRLGLEPVFPISAEHGRGLEPVLDAALALTPETEAAEASAAPAEIRVAIIGRPNVGKSTLLNALCGAERAIVSEIPGTTRDAVDALVVRGGVRYRIVDTAGIRRKGVTSQMAEKLSVVMARKHLEQSDLALIVIDGGDARQEGVLALDATIAGYAFEAARSCIIVVNKWDQADAMGRTKDGLETRIRERLKFLAFAPVVFLSARERTGLDKLFATMARVARARSQRVPTAAMNRFLATLDLARLPVPAGQRFKVYYMTQLGVAPPRFVLVADHARQLHFALRRYLENRIRQAFGFEGTPIDIRTRASKGRPRSART